MNMNLASFYLRLDDCDWYYSFAAAASKQISGDLSVLKSVQTIYFYILFANIVGVTM